ncbi:hypothetical protein EF096_15610 [Pseudomonas neustonica]|uniref:Uncharacterized protein n=1 Tax=Pseudomonas neustonica TaxID=2487346 RepID=A0ABX9XEN1_9PSED|nr:MULTISPECIES: hypothetical protein [Pseudomonas]ROZ80890.1 hypothetical protein EF099_16080 [Pseudomonas sp. SSM44]ROZ82087.1 hypothetical protein EF096_15610 [Pseudomonas neustonica]|tara:strand:+ start:1915 stop:2382 length:468 start_codon:yes stop_codon:yes gene_type:complete
MDGAQTTWELLRVAVPALFIAIGWKVVSADNNARETRKEIRGFLDRTISQVEALCEQAVAYFTCEDDDDAARIASVIDPSLMRLERNLQHLCLKDDNGQVVNAQSVRQSITAHNAYRATPRRVLSCDDPALYEINSRMHDLIQQLEKAYSSSFQR